MISSASFVFALPRSEVVACDIEGEVALLQLRRGAYYGLDPIGARIWHLLSQPQRVAQVRDILTREFQVEEQQCERDLIALLVQMAEAELIEVQSEVA
jgi:hypothetical protein